MSPTPVATLEPTTKLEPAAKNASPRGEALLSIGAAAAQAGVSVRALRYYQQRGLLAPGCTSGGLRRYTDNDLARVARIRELQSLLGLDLDEIATVLQQEDRVAQIRAAYFDRRTSDPARRELLRESLALHLELRTTIESKRASLDNLLNDIDARIQRIHRIQDELASTQRPKSSQPKPKSTEKKARQRP
jgi:DNA-binding transcriptional MerR regulator